jgi:glycosyltransferase involved in cell wall biosynthesis
MSDADLPEISIVTPSFNQGRYVEWTMRSVLLQRYPRLEYIVMDGGSTDDTLQRVERYRDRLAHFESGPDGGQSAAIAAGFARSRGEIMAYLNSDDVLLPGTLNYVVDYFRRHPEVDFIYSHRCFIDEANRVTGYWILPPHSDFMMRRWDLIPQETCFWRRGLYEKAGGMDPSFRFAMDYDLFVRFMAHGRLRRVPRVLGAFRVHREAKTTTQLLTIGQEEVSRVYRKYGIRPVPVLGKLFSLFVQARSARFLASGEALPGLQRGSGFDLDHTWAGLLEPAAECT